MGAGACAPERHHLHIVSLCVLHTKQYELASDDSHSNDSYSSYWSRFDSYNRIGKIIKV